jgi:hypothetical protein
MASPRNRLYGAEVVLSLWASAAGPALAQSGACVLSPAKHNPSEQILRCGFELTITPAPRAPRGRMACHPPFNSTAEHSSSNFTLSGATSSRS